MAVISFIFLMGDSCDAPQPTASSGVSKHEAKVQTDLSGWTIEQHNVADRLKVDNTPGAIKYLYVISPYSGQVLIYSTVKGKVTSSGKRLTPTTVASASGQYVDSAHSGFSTVGGQSTGEVLQDDGTYGSSVDYIYWWDVQGRYHQHFFTGGQIIHVSDQPLPVKSVLINVSAEGVAP